MFLKRSRAWMTVEPIMLVYMFASFLTYPTFQQLLYSSVCSTTPNCTQPSSINDTHVQRSCGNESSPVEEEVRTKVSHWILYNNLATSIPAILSAIFYGSFSDVYGRRIFIVLPAVGGMLNAVVVLSVSYFSPGKVYLYLIGSFVIGLTGGFSVLNFATYSYMADVSTVDQRTLKLSLLESMMYLGATLSSFVSGVWIKRDGFAPPYWGILACYTVVAMYTVLFLPETSTKKSLLLETRTTYGYSAVSSNSSFSNSSCRANILSSIVSRIFHFFYLLFTSWRVALLCFVFFVVEINFLGVTDIIVLYSINKLCWSSDWIGYFLGSKVFFNAVAALVCLPLLTAFFKATDTTILLMGLTSSVAALVTMGTASKTWIMLLAPVIGGMRGCVVPVIRSMLSKLTPPTCHGVMFSGLSAIEASSMLMASAVYNALFPATYSITPGFCFYLMILILLLPITCTVVLHLKQQQTPSPAANDTSTIVEDDGLCD